MRLSKYIYEYQKQGFSDMEIYQLLLQSGWDKKDIDEAFEGAERLRRFERAIKNPAIALKNGARFFIAFFLSLPIKIISAGVKILAIISKYAYRAMKYLFSDIPSVTSRYLSEKRRIKKRDLRAIERVTGYIEKNLKAGALENDILVALLKSRWDERVINKAFARVHWNILKENVVLFAKALILSPFTAARWLAKTIWKITKTLFIDIPTAVFNAFKYGIIYSARKARYIFMALPTYIKNLFLQFKLYFAQKIAEAFSRIKSIFAKKPKIKKEAAQPEIIISRKISLKIHFLLTVNKIKYLIKSYPSASRRFYQRISFKFSVFLKRGAGKIIRLPIAIGMFVKYELKFYLKNIFIRYPSLFAEKIVFLFRTISWRGLIKKFALFIIKIIAASISFPFVLIKKLFAAIWLIFKKIEDKAFSPMLDVVEYSASRIWNSIKKIISPFAGQITAVVRSSYRLIVPIPLEPSYLPQSLSEVPIGQIRDTMSVLDVLKIASRMFKTRRMRTFLTILGIGIGIGAILFLVSLGYGLQKILVEEIATSDALLSLDVSTRDEILIPLNKESLDKLSRLPEVSYVSPLVSIPGQVTLGDVTANTIINGIKPSYFKLAGISTNVGQLFKEGEEDKVLISLPLVRLLTLGQLNGGEVTRAKMDNLLGKTVEIILLVPIKATTGLEETQTIEFSMKFTISGIIEDSAESLIYFPISHIENAGITNYQSAKIKVVNNSALELVRARAVDMGYIVAALSDTIEQANKVFQVLQIVLALFGVVALIVSAIGMFNTMTIALLERTQEIGIMKSLGASNGNIWGLFLTESIIMGFLGGIAGIAIGYIGSEGFNLLVRILASALGGKYVQLFERPWWFIITIVTFSTAVGLFTGLWPARRAANLKILTALRYK